MQALNRLSVVDKLAHEFPVFLPEARDCGGKLVVLGDVPCTLFEGRGLGGFGGWPRFGFGRVCLIQ